MMARLRRSIRLSEEEWLELEREALLQGTNVSAVFRQRAFGIETIDEQDKLRGDLATLLHSRSHHTSASVETSQPQEPLSVHRAIRLTPSDWLLVCERADLVGLSTTRYMRHAVLGQRISGRLRAEAVRQLADVANDLAQLTRLAQDEGALPRHQRLDEVAASIEAALRELL